MDRVYRERDIPSIEKLNDSAGLLMRDLNPLW